MSKRSWHEAQDINRSSTSPAEASLQSSLQHNGNAQGPSPKRASFGNNGSVTFSSSVGGSQDHGVLNQRRASMHTRNDLEQTQSHTRLHQEQSDPFSVQKTKPEVSGLITGITRKVKACAACRKQKIKCLMDDDRPPCRRCKERNLSCVLNKSLQSHMDDESRWRNTVSHDLVHVHKALDDVLRSLSRPSLPPLETTTVREQHRIRHEEDASTPTELGNDMCDMSPQLSPTEDSLTQIPIESLYEITRLRSLRSAAVGVEAAAEPPTNEPTAGDFISKGIIELQEAQRFFQFYITKLDPYMYGIGSTYSDLQTLRTSSTILTACICTVAALHDPNNNKLYESCNKEFRRLIANTMFDRHLSVDYLRALCIGSYWLSDVSWTLSGLAVRRAADFPLHKFYYQAIAALKESSPSASSRTSASTAIDRTRLWYLLYICDQHLSILYNRAPMIREEDTILGWKAYSECQISTDSDMRISSQVALLLIMSQIRDLFGTDTSEPIPKAFATHIANFGQQLDKWLAQWSTALQRNEFIGDFPSKGVLLHYHFGKLNLCAHVFRGLKTENPINAIPVYFLDAASTAVKSAITILELILQDVDLRDSLLGVPHYFHTMIAFAGVVLLKVSSKYHSQLSVDLEYVFSLASNVIALFRSTACSKYHLVHWMATGLEKMLQNCKVIQARKFQSTNNITDAELNDYLVEMDPRVCHNDSDRVGLLYDDSAALGMLGNDFGSDLNMLMSDYAPEEFDLGFNFL